ncbi:hypothetical protein PATSB16_20590 [Pandoraea thiooxydans]|nr:hypothetical protein PATSB16_20590 [Pandoraea thiooxydans]
MLGHTHRAFLAVMVVLPGLFTLPPRRRTSLPKTAKSALKREPSGDNMGNGAIDFWFWQDPRVPA